MFGTVALTNQMTVEKHSVVNLVLCASSTQAATPDDVEHLGIPLCRMMSYR